MKLAHKGRTMLWVAALMVLAAACVFATGTSEGAAAGAPAAPYPVKTVTLITHSSPGGGSDVFLREMIKFLGPQMGVTFVVKNTTGGSGSKALAELAQSPADGSVFYATTPTCIQAAMLSKFQYTIDDVEPMVNFFQDPMVIYVRKDSPIKSLQEVISTAKANPGKMSWGTGTAAELGREILEKLKGMAGVQVNVVSFEGGADMILNVLNGTLDAGAGDFSEVTSQAEAGNVRLLAFFTDKRLAKYPDVPTAIEQGVNLSLSKFRGLTGPKGLPPEVVQAWEAAVPKLLANPEYQKLYTDECLVPAFMDQKTFQAYVKSTQTDLRTYLTDMGILK
jgi:putative tricarboxylic transport membrane protein